MEVGALKHLKVPLQRIPERRLRLHIYLVLESAEIESSALKMEVHHCQVSSSSQICWHHYVSPEGYSPVSRFVPDPESLELIFGEVVQAVKVILEFVYSEIQVVEGQLETRDQSLHLLLDVVWRCQLWSSRGKGNLLCTSQALLQSFFSRCPLLAEFCSPGCETYTP